MAPDLPPMVPTIWDRDDPMAFQGPSFETIGKPIRLKFCKEWYESVFGTASTVPGKKGVFLFIYFHLFLIKYIMFYSIYDCIRTILSYSFKQSNDLVWARYPRRQQLAPTRHARQAEAAEQGIQGVRRER